MAPAKRPCIVETGDRIDALARADSCRDMPSSSAIAVDGTHAAKLRGDSLRKPCISSAENDAACRLQVDWTELFL